MHLSSFTREFPRKKAPISQIINLKNSRATCFDLFKKTISRHCNKITLGRAIHDTKFHSQINSALINVNSNAVRLIKRQLFEK